MITDLSSMIADQSSWITVFYRGSIMADRSSWIDHRRSVIVCLGRVSLAHMRGACAECSSVHVVVSGTWWRILGLKEFTLTKRQPGNFRKE